MQPDFVQPWGLSQNITYSAMDALLVNDHHQDFSSSYATPEASSGVTVGSLLSTMFSDQAVEFLSSGNEICPASSPIETTFSSIGMLDCGTSGFVIEDICKWLFDDENNQEKDSSKQFTVSDIQSPCTSLESCGNSQVCLTIPGDDMKTDDQIILCHLLRQHAESMENGYKELAEVIARHILERINPIGGLTERVAFHLLQAPDKTGNYLKEEATKNIEPAFNVIYRSFLYGRFAHFIANESILGNIPEDKVDSVHIVDFDMGEGVQWPPVIEAVCQKKLELRITSIKFETESNNPSLWKFEETKRRLYDHARACGLKLQVEQMSLDSLMTELRRMKKKSKGREWTAFNCMIGLPHMGRRRHRGEAVEFLGAAKEYLADFGKRRGIITFGDGEAGLSVKPSSSYASFFASYLGHYHALFESMERSFPIHLGEARIAMESLFLAPYIQSDSWFQQWKALNQFSDIQESYALEGCRLNKENIIEAKEMVNESNSLYRVNVEGLRDNELVLEFRDTPLVRVSSWT